MTDAPQPDKSPFAEFGALAPLFDGTRYLAFLNLSHQPEDSVAALKAIVEAAALSLEADITASLSPVHGWRSQVVGASAAIVAAAPSEPTIQALWAALDEPSWASPQLAVAAFLLDPDFASRARRRIEALCRVDPVQWRHQHPDTTMRGGPDAKQLAAMIALCRQHGGLAWLDDLVARPETQAVLAADRDGGGDIATAWLAKARHWLSPAA
ncbi:hypothetical protein PMI01_01567 [Caulobacter sp. AP07]|uniref:hypothetical protein n=1 Tax=Caulobacter sp. AP07 TaxID=1144304 RepID=UPI0002721AF2|nr:hypothetical protein [Caulobacter sp. AP07]EJL34510.1 hypothetical protein PMI01_01567 [Caulobacter sp. AP07]